MQSIKTLSNLDADLKFLSQSDLVSQTLELVKKEKETTLKILHYLREIFRRRLFAELGYSSLFEFAVKHLGYTPAAAQRRIEAMRLLTELPILEEKVKAGELQLSTLAMTQGFFKSERKENNKTYTLEQKQELISKLSGKTTREVEKVFVKISPNYNASQHKDKERQITEEKILFQFTADQELKDLLTRVKALIASPQDLNPSYETMFKKLAKFYLKHKDPVATEVQNLKTAKQTTVTPAPNEAAHQGDIDQRNGGQAQLCNNQNSTEQSTNHQATTAAVTAKQPESQEKSGDHTKSPSRYISINIKKALFTRAQNRCEYVSSITNARCSSTAGLQIEHIRPHSCSGSNTIDNLKIYCAAHNQFSAVKFFGKNKMAQYLRL